MGMWTFDLREYEASLALAALQGWEAPEYLKSAKDGLYERLRERLVEHLIELSLAKNAEIWEKLADS